MRDFPIFDTEFGLSSLVLKEIPYRNEAYIHIRSVLPGKEKEHLKECVSFCKMVGADRIFAAGEGLEDYPVYTAVLQMRGPAEPDPNKCANLFPVTEQTVGQWRTLYNEKMRQVDNAGTLEKKDEKRLLDSTGAVFVHEDGKLLGIGWVEDNALLAVAAAEPGSGERILHTLMTLCEDTMTLEVASTNTKARRLYEKLGFVVTGERIVWHEVGL